MFRRPSGRSARLTVAGALAAAILAAFATVAGVGLSQVSGSASGSDEYQYGGQKVTICHHTHSKKNKTVTITISQAALPAHLRHGDTVGPCPPKSGTTPDQPNHGKGNGHGKGKGK